jgi:hypothetical protein
VASVAIFLEGVSVSSASSATETLSDLRFLPSAMIDARKGMVTNSRKVTERLDGEEAQNVMKEKQIAKKMWRKTMKRCLQSN